MNSKIELVRLEPAMFKALANGDLEAANRMAPVPLTPGFVSPERWAGWRRACLRIAAGTDTAWLVHAVWARDQRLVVGRAGFHGAPDEEGLVEVAYGIEPAHRRQGYARAALLALLDRTASEPSVRGVRAVIRPGNTASRHLAARCGFTQLPEHDLPDGPWVVYEWPVIGVVTRNRV